MISSSAKSKPNITSRREKGFGIVSEILSILSEVPLGKYKIQIALILRQAMLINGILHNSEAWSDIKLEDIKMLEDVDEYLLRSIFKAHSKTPLEFLHLETGTKPIRYIIASRRINYLYNILNKPDSELIKRVYEAQKLKTTKGDWIELIKRDFELIEEDFDEDFIKETTKYIFKKFVKTKITKAAFKYLESIKNGHSKIRDIKYNKLEVQPYILSDELSNEEISSMFAVRSRMTNVKRNFINKFNQNLSCTLGCEVEENQEHLLDCKFLIDKLEDKSILAECEYSEVFGNIDQQIKMCKIFSKILKIKEELVD